MRNRRRLTPPLVTQFQGEGAAAFKEETTQTASQLHAENNMQNFDAYGQMIGPAEAFQEASLAKTPETIVNTLPDARAQTKTESLNNQEPGTDPQTDAVAYAMRINGQPVANINIKQEAYNSQGIHLGYNPKRITYPSRDNLSIEIIPKGTLLARLEPGGDFFIVNDEAGWIIESRDAAKISEACQVAPVERFGGYRQKLIIYETTEDIPGAVGKALTNDQYGTGGVNEAFIKNLQELEDMKIFWQEKNAYWRNILNLYREALD